MQAPFLLRNQRVKYDPRLSNVTPSDDGVGVEIITPREQSGLRSVFRDGDSDIDFRNSDILGSDSGGRIQVIQDLGLH